MANNSEDISSKQLAAKNQFCQLLAEHLKPVGYSKELFSHINDTCGFSKNYYLVLFPGGAADIAKYFEDWQDQQMLEFLLSREKPAKIREQIAAALIYRIINIVPKDAAFAQSSFFLMPENIIDGNAAAWQTCDHIWRYAGDKSTDFNHYTKRGLLFSVYLAAKTYYFADESEGYEKTKIFIKDALDNIINIASLKNKVSLPGLDNIPFIRMFL
jgi:ubiquinone biosynthesis protein COQ9